MQGVNVDANVCVRLLILISMFATELIVAGAFCYTAWASDVMLKIEDEMKI